MCLSLNENHDNNNYNIDIYNKYLNIINYNTYLNDKYLNITEFKLIENKY